jgi:hypothetical protein
MKAPLQKQGRNPIGVASVNPIGQVVKGVPVGFASYRDDFHRCAQGPDSFGEKRRHHSLGKLDLIGSICRIEAVTSGRSWGRRPS